ncbi:MAG TPA: hypothetical protein VK817_22035 [Trebonia sp.]|jgi:hypothetical protein|nr:hypothetical protein [Trebonia sp.]
MPDNDARDPLDSWLDQQVKPLPPPPGTFDMISRRARRRKARKLAVTVVSAAAVAAAVVVAVPGVTSLHLGTSGESGNTVADGGAKSNARGTGGGTAGLNGSGTRSVTPTPTEAAPPTSNGGPPDGPVPADFAPTSVTFVSATHAWVIGQAGTPGKCYNGSICTSVAWTSDDGATWHGEPAPVAGTPDGPSGVSGIRFLDGVNGWAFGPELWVTHDSGNTWHQLDTNGLRVTDLETAGNQAYALFANCSGSSSAGYAADCTSYTLMTTTATSDNWVPVGNATSDLSRDGRTGSAMLALTGTNGYLVAPDGTVYSGPLGGTWSAAGTAPCQPSSLPQADGLPAAGMFALTSANDLTMACDGGPSATSQPAIYASDDGGANWTQQSAAAWSNVAVPESSITSLAAAPNGALVLATTDGVYVLPSGSSTWQAATAAGAGATSGGLSAGGTSGNSAPSTAGASASVSPSSSATSGGTSTGGTSTGGTSNSGSGATDSGLPSGGFSYIGMTSDSQGVAIPADTSLDEIWLTTDGGLTWSPSAITG